MTTTASQRKVKVLQSENKKPPKLSTSLSKESEKEISSDQEKIYLEGEPHIEDTTEEKEIMCPPIDEKMKIGRKNLEIFRPREKYLKEKMSQLNYDEKLLTDIQKDLGNQVEDIKTQIQEKNIMITEVPKDLNKYIVRSSSTENKIIKYSNEDYELKKKHKIIKELKEEEITLKQKLKKIDENENLLNNEGFMNLNNSTEKITKFDKSLNEQHKKNIKNKKNELNERLKEVQFQLEQYIQQDNFNKYSKKEKLEIFKSNFERDKEIIEERAKKYLKETNERNKRLAKDMNQLIEKRKKEIEQKQKEDEEKKKKILDKMIEKEKAIEKARLKEKTDLMLKYKPYRLEKCEKTQKDYLFDIYDKRYQKQEQKLLDQVNNTRKLKNKTVTSEELENFWVKIDEKKEELKKIKEKKDKKEMEKFEMCKSYKPSYVSQFNEMVDDEYNKLMEKEKIKKDEIMALKKLKEDYGKKRSQVKYDINEKLKKERMDKILILENPKLVQIKDTFKEKLKNGKKKRILLKKRDPTKPSKYPWLEKSLEKLQKLNNSAILESNVIKKPKKIRYTSYSARKEKQKEEDEKEENKDKKEEKGKKEDKEKIKQKIDYLQKMRKKRLKKESSQNEINNEERRKKWEEKLGKNENIISNINSVKNDADNLGKKAEMEEQLLKLNGGVANNPQLGKKVSGLLIGSIEAKLSILNQMYKQ